jgi:hypothetical protein
MKPTIRATTLHFALAATTAFPSSLAACNLGSSPSSPSPSPAPAPTSDLQCSGKADFTPCHAAGAALHYDICVDQVCQVPGCGEASCNAPAPHFPLPGTSQIKCYDDAAEIACPPLPCGANQAYCGQDAQYGWDAKNPGKSRFTRDTSVPGQPVVTDTITGLVWQGCSLGWGGDQCDVDEDDAAMSIDWSESLDACDSLDWGGHTDWHMPDDFELLSHADYQSMGADPIAFPNTTPDYFRASTTRSADDHLSFDLFLGQGYLNADATKLGLYYTRCVRGGSAVTRTFSVTSSGGQPVVVDNVTGLTWQGCVVGLSGDGCDENTGQRLNWKDALAACESLSWDGFRDWRMPNVFELRSIVKTTIDNPSIDSAAFPGTPASWTWSSTTWPDFPTEAFGVSFGYGDITYLDKDFSQPNYVRCVRDEK